MKKILYNSLSLLFGAVLLTSCLKDDRLVLDPEKSSNVVEFGNTGTPTSPTGAPVFAYTPVTLNQVATQSFTTSVNYAGPENVAPQDITVTLAAAPEAITAWNAAYPSAATAAKYNQLPAGTYTFPATVTIPKGQRSVSFTIEVKPLMLNSAQTNVLGIKIASASYGTLSGNFGTVIYNLPVKSMWDGAYTFSVSCPQDANLNKTGLTGVRLSTIAPNRVRLASLAESYSGNVEYQFDGANANLTELKAFSGANLVTAIVSQTVNSTAKTFSVVYTFSGRTVTETWTRTGD
ncbi:MAG: DUF1735 domain-containing protein [Pedobacter sp.]|nr:MAG: DUF1735 domain-containing protein [Pedobacter sp.]